MLFIVSQKELMYSCLENVVAESKKAVRIWTAKPFKSWLWRITLQGAE